MDLAWTHKGKFGIPLKALRLHTVILGQSGTGKTETIQRFCYGARKVYQFQVIYLDAKGETKREEERAEDNAARFTAAMYATGAKTVKVFPSLHYNGWQGDVTALRNRLLSVIDTSESPYYGDVAANVVDLALSAPTTPRSSDHFLANLRLERLKAIYQNDRHQLQRVLNLDKDLIKQVEMRYHVFFRAMQGQLDGSLDYANADAVYLRVRGFTLRNEAPRLGRFLVSDFMHYVAERKRSGVKTLFVIDEFNALHLREETSVLFEQARSFGGSLVISAQGYAGLGPTEYAERILDACNTYVLHACSDPFPIIKRAGKHLYLDTSWNEDQEGNARRTTRPHWDWKVTETDVIQQDTGQAFWIHRGRVQQAQTAQVPLTQDQIRDAWREIHREVEIQRQLSEVDEQRRQARKAQQKEPVEASNTAQSGSKKGEARSNITSAKKPKQQQAAPSSTAAAPAPVKPALTSEPEPTRVQPSVPPIPDPYDDEPDRL
jgi:hypothetical protein